jgi:hypothetical protein
VSVRSLFIYAVSVALSGVAVLSGPGRTVAGGGTPITVGPNVRVSSANTDVPHYEVMLAEDPADPKRFLACSIIAPSQDEYEYETVAYLSTNGGLSWRPTLETHNTGSGDPACAFGPDGEAYFAELQEAEDPDGHQHGHTFVYVSRDAGSIWSSPLRLRQADREYITVDDTNGPRRGRVYVNAAMSTRNFEDDPYHPTLNDTNGFGLLVSGDRGSTFQLESLLDPAPTGWTFADGNAIVLPNGTYAAIVPVVPRSVGPDGKFNVTIDFVASANGGETFAKAVTVRTAAEPAGPEITAMWLPSLAIDRGSGPFHGRLYTAWGEEVDGREQILIAYSSDDGAHWSAPATVDDDVGRADGKGPDDSEPIVAVNPEGVVGVTWYDRRNSSDDLGSYERFSASLDGGETFLPSVRVAEAASRFRPIGVTRLDGSASGGGDRLEYSRGKPLTATIGYNSRFAFIGGDTQGLVVDPSGSFHALWVDNRTGTPQVWTAPIRVEGRAEINGSAELATMTDVTNRMTLLLTNSLFDPRDSTVTVDASIVNTSGTAIKGPIVGRFVTLTSRLGGVTLEESDNPLHSRGAAVRFIGDGGQLLPNQRTQRQRLVFHLATAGDMQRRNDASSLEHFVDFTLRLFARKQ